MRYAFVLYSLLALSAHAHEPIAKTKLGELKGVHLNDQGVVVFKGVPYGQSTAGANRFKAPKPVAKWSGVKDATKFGNVCPQAGEVGRRTKVEGELLPIGEDCLVLNIWTPNNDAKSRPVMVWFHGRGFYAGAGSERLYDGARLAKRGDLVVVTVNHRLNAFGYLYLGKVGGDAFATSGNAGVQDMQLALEWVRDNISAFGGDPKNVTIFGESGGGAKVSTLLGVPSAKGLFQRGIIQSGPRLNGMPVAAAIKSTETVMQKLNVTTAEQLQAVPMDKLIAAIATNNERTSPDFGPVTDGKYLPADMFVPAAAPSAHNVPVIIGSNRDEYSLYARSMPNFGKMTEEEMLKNLQPEYGAHLNELVAAYKQSRPNASPWDLMVAIRSNRFHIGTIRLAEAQSKVAPTYVYSFDFEPTPLKAAHGAEIPFVFSNATADANARPGAKEAEDAMSEAWIAFARTGKPNHAGMPEWPTYNATTRPVMVFNAKTQVVNDPRAPERKVWEGKQLVR